MGVSTAKPTINSKKTAQPFSSKGKKKTQVKPVPHWRHKMKKVTLPSSLMDKYLHNLISEGQINPSSSQIWAWRLKRKTLATPAIFKAPLHAEPILFFPHSTKILKTLKKCCKHWAEIFNSPPRCCLSSKLLLSHYEKLYYSVNSFEQEQKSGKGQGTIGDFWCQWIPVSPPICHLQAHGSNYLQRAHAGNVYPRFQQMKEFCSTLYVKQVLVLGFEKEKKIKFFLSFFQARFCIFRSILGKNQKSMSNFNLSKKVNECLVL